MIHNFFQSLINNIVFKILVYKSSQLTEIYIKAIITPGHFPQTYPKLVYTEGLTISSGA